MAGGDRDAAAVAVCPLCLAVESAAAVVDGGPAVAIPDANPLSAGHHLVVSRRHEPDFFALTPAEVAAMFAVAFDLRRLIAEQWQPAGFNVGVNVGAAAGQTIGHVHLHVIPRYHGDSADPRGGVRWILPARARYWKTEVAGRPPSEPGTGRDAAR